ncbi:MAG TPA: TonB-dependent receptor [Thermoanaerobaculia bacterium]|nr:TonB-dependent receptor [Thermoanaerobaculia bacterium]
MNRTRELLQPLLLCKTTLRTFVMLMVVILAAGSVQAQTTTATLRGKVIDESGNAFPNAEITATAVGIGYRHTTTAGADGSFLLAGLTPGAYTIEVVAPAYRASTREVTLQVGSTIELDFRLRPDTVLMDEITVIGSTPVEMETSEVATNVTRRQIESLPQNDRNFLNFAALAPGVQLGTDEFRKEVKAGAQSSSATNVFIDGVSFKNDVIQGGVVGQDASRGNPFPQNAVQEFRVITQNFSAEYQKASSAIITAITKSGSNQLTGDAFFFYQDKELVDENPLNGSNPEYERNQYGLSLGGPIIRDRMHFFASYEANDQTREETVNTVSGGGAFSEYPALIQRLQAFGGTHASPFRSDLFFGKVSFQPNYSQLFDGSVNVRKETDVRGFGGFTSVESAENAKNDVWGATLRHQFTGSTWLNEASVSFQDFNWNPTPLNYDQVGQEYEGLLRVGGRDTEQDIGQQRLAFRDDVTFSSIRFGPGTHTIKVGGNVELLDYTVRKLFVENPVFYYRTQDGPDVPYRARFGFGNPDMSAENQQYGIYGQDDWSVNDKLTLNIGLRWDYETNMFDTDYVTPANVRAALADQFPANYFTDGNDREPKSDMFQPRLGASYDLFANGKTILFGGAGRYYDRNLFNNTLDERFRLQHAVYDFQFSVDGRPGTVKWDPRFLTIDGLKEVIASGATGKPEIFLIENDTEVPYSNQWNIGVRQSFGSMVASASYANIRSYHGMSFLWGQGFCCPQYDPNFGQVLISSDDVRTWYDAVYLTLDRPYSDQARFGFNVAYTYADAEQVGGDLFSLDLPEIADWPRYGTPGTSDHRIVANGILGLPWDMRLSSLLQYSSGDKFRIHDFSQKTPPFCVGCYVPVTGEGPSWTTVDLRVDKDFRFGGNYRVGLTAEAFNIFNEERYGGFVDFNPPEGNPNLGNPTSIVGGSQRRYQFGVRLGF